MGACFSSSKRQARHDVPLDSRNLSFDIMKSRVSSASSLVSVGNPTITYISMAISDST